MLADKADCGRLPAFVALALRDLEADLAAWRDVVELALNHAVAVEIELWPARVAAMIAAELEILWDCI
jgi:hypothetical protein